MTRLLSWRWLVNLFLELALLCVLVTAFFIRTPQVSGLSMAPQIASGEYVLIDTLSYKFVRPARGDVIAFRHSTDPESDGSIFIKRVIGLPGDRVSIDRGNVYVNGKRLDEPYVEFHDDRSYPLVVVPEGALYVLGDNRADSEDSRYFGCIPEQSVIGRALAGIWPPQSLRAL
jgi:signal peptidase I